MTGEVDDFEGVLNFRMKINGGGCQNCLRASSTKFYSLEIGRLKAFHVTMLNPKFHSYVSNLTLLSILQVF